jgi:hypothetical protein
MAIRWTKIDALSIAPSTWTPVPRRSSSDPSHRPGRKRFLPPIQALFVDVLRLARTMGMLKLNTLALDGTKFDDNAGRHSALSYGQANRGPRIATLPKRHQKLESTIGGRQRGGLVQEKLCKARSSREDVNLGRVRAGIGLLDRDEVR